MRIFQKSLPLLTVCILTITFAKADSSFIESALMMLKRGSLNQETKDKLLGNLLKTRLESHHFSKKFVDDKLSKNAFKEYLKKLDYRKRFLLQSDVKQLKKFEIKIDDQMVTGNLELSKLANKIRTKRIRMVSKMSKEILKKPFDFKKKESLELDPDKRQFLTSEKELRNLWRKILKLDTLSRIKTLTAEQEEDSKKAKDKKTKDKKKVAKKDKKKKKKLSPKEIAKKAHDETVKSYKKVFERLLKEDHYDELAKIFNAVCNVFDPHTVYLPPRDKENFNIEIKGSLEGIGALLREDGDYIKVVEIIPGSASWKQGKLQADDIILKVAQGKKEPVDIVGMRVEEAVQYIRGKKGSEVRLHVKKQDGTQAVIPIVRDTVIIEETYAKSAIIEDKKDKTKVGYILVPKFYRDFSKRLDDQTARNVTTDVKKALIQFKKAKVDGVVVDLRNNGGGSLEDARLMSGLFIEKGPIVQIKYSDGKVDTLKDYDPTVTYDGPLVVLQNTYSASASEIVAGALKDYNRAVIVGGKKSHGKGTVQTLLELDQGLLRMAGSNESLGSLKLTISKFYRVSGSSTQYKGIEPHIVLPDPYAYADTGESSLDFSLPWDEVAETSHTKWKNPPKNISQLIKNSAKRVAKNEKFQKIIKSVNLLKGRKDETLVSLNQKESKEKDKKYKKLIEKLKYDEEKNKNIVVSFGHLPKLDNKDKKLLKNKQKKRTDFGETLQTDPYIEESLKIVGDMIQFSKSGKQMVSKSQ